MVSAGLPTRLKTPRRPAVQNFIEKNGEYLPITKAITTTAGYNKQYNHNIITPLTYPESSVPCL